MTDESYIQLAIEIAKKGTGSVSPNPLVGCVIVKNNKIIGAGYHQKYGGNHAEINAINDAKENVEGSTLYINLEPCSHHEKTPPCVNRIRSGLPFNLLIIFTRTFSSSSLQFYFPFVF